PRNDFANVLIKPLGLIRLSLAPRHILSDRFERHEPPKAGEPVCEHHVEVFAVTRSFSWRGPVARPQGTKEILVAAPFAFGNQPRATLNALGTRFPGSVKP